MIQSMVRVAWNNALGTWWLVAQEDVLIGLYPPTHRRTISWSDESPSTPSKSLNKSDYVLKQTIEQLEQYFAGDRQTFSVPTKLIGTDFQLAIWKALQSIPYGSTSSYGELAKKIGATKAARAVGAANGRNPISIIYPCHRVIGSSGQLTGYAGGLQCKQKLLEMEHHFRMGKSTMFFDPPLESPPAVELLAAAT